VHGHELFKIDKCLTPIRTRRRIYMSQSGLTKEAYDVYSVINSHIFICTC